MNRHHEEDHMRKDAPIVAVFRAEIIRKDQIALDDISIEIETGSWTEIIGVSGAGKSDLFEALSLRKKPRVGQVLVSGMNLDKMDERALSEARFLIGSCAQKPLFLEHQSVLSNMMLPQLIRGVDSNQAREDALRMLDAFEIAKLGEQRMATIDFDDRLRVAISRALMGDVRLVIIDGLLSMLSEHARHIAVRQLALANLGGTTVVSFDREPADFIEYHEHEKRVIFRIDRNGIKRLSKQSHSKLLKASAA